MKRQEQSAADQTGNMSAERRFRLLDPAEMSDAQRTLVAAIQSGPRGKVAGSAANSQTGTVGGPFNVFLRSPELGDYLQKAGSYVRFGCVLGNKLTELAILVTARYWSAQYEWYAHHRLALQAGLDPLIAEAIANGREPAGMDEQETAVYRFSRELHHDKQVSDESFQAIVRMFGEQGVMDLIGVNGYYTVVSMVLNTDCTPIPEGVAPLPVLNGR